MTIRILLPFFASSASVPAQQKVSSSGCGVKSRIVLPRSSSSRVCSWAETGTVRIVRSMDAISRIRVIKVPFVGLARSSKIPHRRISCPEPAFGGGYCVAVTHKFRTIPTCKPPLPEVKLHNMPFCANCGSQVDGRFCPKCGAAIAGGAGPAAAPAGVPSPGGTPYAAATPVGLTDNVASALCYSVGFITGILFLVLAPYNQNPKIRFHAFQSIFLNVAFIIIWIVFSIIALVSGGWFVLYPVFMLIGLGL